MSKNQCSNCRWWTVHKGDRTGDCDRFPLKVVRVYRESCGEFVEAKIQLVSKSELAKQEIRNRLRDIDNSLKSITVAMKGL